VTTPRRNASRRTERNPSDRIDADAGEPLAESAESDAESLRERRHTATLGTVLVSDSEADERFTTTKHERCAAVGIETERVDVTARQAGYDEFVRDERTASTP
jgi:5,10-methylene-tetrahydrofolate dehydrogenase/methenyl tetrahydrofolate cyclohydrolase